MSLRCKILGCTSCRPNSDDLACWGECVRCGKKHGYLDRRYIWRAIEAEEAYKKAWKEYTLEGMDP